MWHDLITQNMFLIRVGGAAHDNSDACCCSLCVQERQQVVESTMMITNTFPVDHLAEQQAIIISHIQMWPSVTHHCTPESRATLWHP